MNKVKEYPRRLRTLFLEHNRVLELAMKQPVNQVLSTIQFDLPDDAIVLGVQEDFPCFGFRYLIWSSEFTDVDEGVEPPSIPAVQRIIRFKLDDNGAPCAMA